MQLKVFKLSWHLRYRIVRLPVSGSVLACWCLAGAGACWLERWGMCLGCSAQLWWGWVRWRRLDPRPAVGADSVGWRLLSLGWAVSRLGGFSAEDKQKENLQYCTWRWHRVSCGLLLIFAGIYISENDSRIQAFLPWGKAQGTVGVRSWALCTICWWIPQLPVCPPSTTHKHNKLGVTAVIFAGTDDVSLAWRFARSKVVFQLSYASLKCQTPWQKWKTIWQLTC